MIPIIQEVMKKVILGLLGAVCICVVTFFVGFMLLGEDSKEYSTKYVQSVIDSTYLNKYDVYQELTTSTDDEITQRYQEGLEAEAYFFFYYWDIEYVTDEMVAEVASLHEEIYSHSSYEVKPASEKSAGVYEMDIIINPIDIPQQIIDVYADDIEEMLASYNGYDYDSMSVSEYEKIYEEYDQDFYQAILACYKDALENIGYTDAQTVTVEVTKDSNNIYSLDQTNFDMIDQYIIGYPTGE